MYAIIETGGKQYRVEEGSKVVVEKLAAQAGSEITLDKVLMIGGAQCKIGAPYVAIVGGEELERGAVRLRNMQTKEECEIPLENAVSEIKERA